MTLGQLSLELDGPGRGSILGKFLAVHPDLCPYYGSGQQVDLGVVSRMAHGLDDRVQEGLAKVSVGLECALPLHDKRLLHWDEDAGELRYAHIVLKTLAGRASAARPVLARFQEKGWQEWVRSPFNEEYPEKLKGALRTLKDVIMIKFDVSKDHGVSYKWVDDDSAPDPEPRLAIAGRPNTTAREDSQLPLGGCRSRSRERTPRTPRELPCHPVSRLIIVTLAGANRLAGGQR